VLAKYSLFPIDLASNILDVDSRRESAISGNIFTADISQVAECFEPQTNQLLIERVQFAHRGNVEQNTTEETDITFKRALSRNEATEEMSRFCVLDFDRVKFLGDGLKEGSDEFVGGKVQHDRSPRCQ
jgi:hypothetical protein